jgi:acetyl esterase/lipase
MKRALLFFTFTLILNFGFCQDTIYLWPGNVPDETAPKHQPVISENKTGEVTRITDITNPALIVFKPNKNVQTNTSIIVCPGGAYQYLAIDKEGYEVADWLNSLGITAYVLQYRVLNKQTEALQDIQRAIRLVRNIDSTQTIGIMGFSAGGSLSALAATNFKRTTYQHIDLIDQISCRPDFAALIYPAYLDLGENKTLTPELTIGTETPPFFLFGTADDTYGNSSLVMTTALRNNKIPVELHIVPKGSHGYGLRKGNVAAETWPSLLQQWLKIQPK